MLGVTPIRVDLAANGSPTVVRVRNEGEESVLVQVEAVQWGVDVDAAARAGEVIAAPPIFELGGLAEQVLRVALRSPLDEPVERAYRLLITEVPRATGPANALTFAVRLNLPIFVTPQGAAPEPVWSMRQGAGGRAELVLVNRGNAHIRVQDLALKAEGRSEPVFASEGAAYALAGETQVWSLEKPLAALPPVLEVSVETNLGPLVAPVARAGG